MAVIRAEIERQWANSTHADVVWPPEFDWDRLERVLAKLEAEKTLWLPHDATNHEEALDDTMELWRRRGATISGLRGYLYYTQRDVDEVTEGHPLRISFGPFAEDVANHEIADIVREVFMKAGFVVTVPADAPDRLAVFPAA
jgi:hypothetical protein